jgi:hypothetical protein
VNHAADKSEDTLRISLDAKDKVKIGNLSRGGKNRKSIHADDHDFGVVGTLVPVGLYLPKEKDLSFYMVRSKVTSDCIVDILENWWSLNKGKYQQVNQLLINLDNGPDQNSQRTQFIKRIQEFADKEKLQIHLAYYPPYHSKYNPVERTFGTLEQYWSGEILDSEETVIGYAKAMKFAEKHPTVSLVTKTYKKGVKVGKKIMNKIKSGLQRTKGIEKYSLIFKPRLDSG